MGHLQAVLEEIQAEYERGTCCGGGRLPESQGPCVPKEGGGGPREDAKDCEEDQKHDPVHSPGHYKRGAIESIDAIDSALEGLVGREAYYTGSACKYLYRWKFKGTPVQDLKKAQWFLSRLLCYIESRK